MPIKPIISQVPSSAPSAEPQVDAPANANTPEGRMAIAAHWAPTWYADTYVENPKADYITRFDFDGDWNGMNNWENLDKPANELNLAGAVYFAVVETDSHYFITYETFHARDWDGSCNFRFFITAGIHSPCHENDMEGVMLAVRKEERSLGKLELAYMLGHSILYPSAGVTVKNAEAPLGSGPITFDGEHHPEIVIEEQTHKTKNRAADFVDGDGIIYRYQRGVSETPTKTNSVVDYTLLPIEETLWAKKDSICNEEDCLYDQEKTLAGQTLGTAFNGDDYRNDKSNPPWGWNPFGARYTGELFLDPAAMLARICEFPGAFSEHYIYNPYLPK